MCLEFIVTMALAVFFFFFKYLHRETRDKLSSLKRIDRILPILHIYESQVLFGFIVENRTEGKMLLFAYTSIVLIFLGVEQCDCGE